MKIWTNVKRKRNKTYDKFNEKVFLNNSLQKSNKKEKLSIFKMVNKMSAIKSFKLSNKSKPLALKLGSASKEIINEYGMKDQATQMVIPDITLNRVYLMRI